ncbi:hypothetical protein I1A43_14835 [Pectobacterium odoriferum]|nr:hypothetical protein [Pectobacterium odoriferum]
MLARHLEDVIKEQNKMKVATNFLFHSIVEVLDAQSGEKKFSDSLKEKIESELAKITSGSVSVEKHAINELMQSPVKLMFSNKKTEPFLK